VVPCGPGFGSAISERNTKSEVKHGIKNGKANQPIKMVIADVDGTLVTQEKILTKRAAEAVSASTKPGFNSALPADVRPAAWPC